ncbi:MAG: hypothetical protein WDN69_34060 [Aliidongia sp.]
MEQQAAEFLFKLLDRLGQGRLGDVAGFRRTRKVQAACERQEISDLIELHILAASAAGIVFEVRRIPAGRWSV